MDSSSYPDLKQKADCLKKFLLCFNPENKVSLFLAYPTSSRADHGMFTHKLLDHQLPCFCSNWWTKNWGRKTNSKTKLSVIQERTGFSFLSSPLCNVCNAFVCTFLCRYYFSLCCCCCWKILNKNLDHVQGGMWLLGRRSENSSNKLSLWQGYGQFNTFMAGWWLLCWLFLGMTPGAMCCLILVLSLYKLYCWLPLVSVSWSYWWNSYYLRTTPPQRLPLCVSQRGCC